MKTIAVLLSITALACAQEVKRPRILGVAHMALYVSDLEKARTFYKDFLGYAEPYKLTRPDGADRIVFLKVNEDQYLELFAESAKGDGQMNHISFYTDDAEAMRVYLASKGVSVPATVGKGQIRNSNFNIKDPDGHTVEIVQYEPDSWTRRETGKFLPATRVSDHMMHVGVVVADLDATLKFYGDILGFKEFWRGGGSPQQLSWVNLRVPDGSDYLELMLYSSYPDAAQLGVKNHICLTAPDLKASVKTLQARAAGTHYTQPIEMKTGVNRKRQANLFDPDGTRVELMERATVDGKAAPSSTAPAPHGQKRASE
jgi:Lactoylglutathione lyase and related lyases